MRAILNSRLRFGDQAKSSFVLAYRCIEQPQELCGVGRAGNDPGMKLFGRSALVRLAEVDYKLKCCVTDLEKICIASNELTLTSGLLRITHWAAARQAALSPIRGLGPLGKPATKARIELTLAASY